MKIEDIIPQEKVEKMIGYNPYGFKYEKVFTDIALKYERMEKMLDVAERALAAAGSHFHSIMSGVTTEIKTVEQLTKQLAAEAKVEAMKALAKIEELKR